MALGHADVPQTTTGIRWGGISSGIAWAGEGAKSRAAAATQWCREEANNGRASRAGRWERADARTATAGAEGTVYEQRRGDFLQSIFIVMPMVKTR